MPILNPHLLEGLISFYFYKREGKRNFKLILDLLKVASNNLFINLDTIKASIRFKKHIKENISFVNKYFGCNVSSEKDFKGSKVTNYYQYIYDHIDTKYKQKISKKTIYCY